MSEFSSARFAILTGKMQCHACMSPTEVSCLLIPGVSQGQEDDRFDPEDPARLQYITDINAEALTAWQELAPFMRWMTSHTANATYLANTCEHCNALQGDWFIGEPDAPFFPTCRAGINALNCKWVEVPLRAEAEASQSSWMNEIVG